MNKGNNHIIKLDQIERKNVFSVPDGYFHSLPDKIEENILELRPDFKTNVYEVPAPYFEQLPQRIDSKILSENTLTDARLRESIYQAPVAYFNDLSESIQDKVSDDLVLDITPQGVHAVPKGYFDSLAHQIEDRIGHGKQVNLFEAYVMPSVRYAVAASVALLLIAGGVFYFQNRLVQQTAKEDTANDRMAVAAVDELDKNDIKLYLEEQDHLESRDLLEFSSSTKIKEIKEAFENDILALDIKDKQSLELELNDVDISELQSEI